MAIEWITRTDVTPGVAATWTDTDFTSYFSSSVKGVILEFDAGTASGYGIGAQVNGATDNYNYAIFSGAKTYLITGVDASDIAELYVADITNIKVYVVGGFHDEAVFFVNTPDKSPATGSWLDMDISGDTGADTAVAAIYRVLSNTSGYNWGLRKNGSTDNRVMEGRYHASMIVGVDGAEINEGNIATSAVVAFRLVGYLKSGATLNTNALDRSLTATAAWTDLTALPSGAVGGIYEVHGTTTSSVLYGFRENGSAINDTGNVRSHLGAYVKCDGSRLVEGYIGATTVDFYEMGHFTVGAATALTSLNAALQKQLAATASMQSALQKPLLATTNLDVAAQKQFTATAALQSAVQKSLSSSAGMSAAAQKQIAALTNLDSALQKQLTATSSLQTALQKGVSATASVQAAVQKTLSITTQVSAALQKALTATASLNAYITGGATFITAQMSAALSKQLSATASLQAAAQKQLQATAVFGAVAQKQYGITAQMSGAVAKQYSVTSSISSALSRSFAATASAEAVLRKQLSVSASWTAAALKSLTASVSLSVYMVGNRVGVADIGDRAAVADINSKLTLADIGDRITVGGTL